MSQDKKKRKPRYNKKFRFQLLEMWLTSRYKPCKVLDVGGGKGLLTYLLNQKGWKATVVDPVEDIWPTKYKDIVENKRIKLSKGDVERIPRIKSEFDEDMAKGYDLLIGLHAHGSNMKIIQACKKHDKDFLLLPCCVIDEPIEKRPNVDWFGSLVEYALKMGFKIKQDNLFFKGQNKLIYTDKNLTKLKWN